MPILAVDKYGRFYQTGRDRSDGAGYSTAPRPVGQRDLTLGAAVFKAQDERKRDILRNKAALNAQAATDALARLGYMKQKQLARAKAGIIKRLEENPARQAAMIRAALTSGKSNGVYNDSQASKIGGNPLSANGLSGCMGQDARGRAISAAAHGVALPPRAEGPHEQKQQLMRALINQGFKQQAATQAAGLARAQAQAQVQRYAQQQARKAYAAGGAMAIPVRQSLAVPQRR